MQPSPALKMQPQNIEQPSSQQNVLQKQQQHQQPTTVIQQKLETNTPVINKSSGYPLNSQQQLNIEDKTKPKPRRSTRGTNERIPKLSVTGIEHDTVINCHMENKQKTITFKFDIRDVNPVDVATKMVNI